MTTPAGSAVADDSSPNAPWRVVRSLGHGAIFLGVCAVVCTGLGRMAPFPEVPGIFPKWNFFQEHRDEFDVLFLGSSRFYHQIIPQQFDAAVGGNLRSFNFGYDGMWPPESYYLLRKILEVRSPRLRWVVIELMNIDSQLDARNNSTARMAYWHDWRHTRMVFQDIREVPRPPEVKRTLFIEHARLWFQQGCNLGRGSEWLGNQLQPRPPRKRAYTWEDSAGFEAGPSHGLPAEDRPHYLDRLAGLREKLPLLPLPPVFRQAVEEMTREVRAAGVEPIYVIAPTVNPYENFRNLPDGAPLIPLNSPTEYPQLFDPDRHYDTWHLNSQGAVDFTTILAARCKPILDAKK